MAHSLYLYRFAAKFYKPVMIRLDILDLNSRSKPYKKLSTGQASTPTLEIMFPLVTSVNSPIPPGHVLACPLQLYNQKPSLTGIDFI